MARFLRGGRGTNLGHSNRESNGGTTEFHRDFIGGGTASFRFSTSSATTITDHLPSPYGPLDCDPNELREMAYEIYVAASRSSWNRFATSGPQSVRERGGSMRWTDSASIQPSSFSSRGSSSLRSFAGLNKSLTSTATSSPLGSVVGLHKSLVSTAASKMKKAFGMKSLSNNTGKDRKKMGVMLGEIVRLHMGVSERKETMIRRALLRATASQLGKRIESMVLPLELLKQLKITDFADQLEYDAWQSRLLKILEIGLLLYPHLPLDKSDTTAQKFRQIIDGASDRPLETGRNSESIQVLQSAVMPLACRSSDGSPSEACHWADGFPLNLHLYQVLLDACFDNCEDGSIINEVDDLLDSIKKTWVILGINQKLHNLCFTWALFHHFVNSCQLDNSLLFMVDGQLAEVAKDVKTTNDPVYSKVLSSILSSILGWAEKRLLAYHDTFTSDSVDIMECILSLGVSAASLQVEDISCEFRRKRREEVDVARNRIDTYIRSSLRTVFAQKMEQAASNRRSINLASPIPGLSILAKDTGNLANKETEIFSPILKKWHPLAAGVAVATLHACYGNELKQFIKGVTELTPDSVQILKDSDRLEKYLVQIAVEDSVDSEDGGKAIIREMPPYEIEYTIANLARIWIKTRVDRLNVWVDRNLQQETWKTKLNKVTFAASAIDVLQVVDETLDAFFRLPIPMHPALLPDLVSELDRITQQYISKAKDGCGTKNTFAPALPALTRCTVESKFGWKKKDKVRHIPKIKSQIATLNGNDNFTLPQLYVRLNTLQNIRVQLENLEKRMVVSLRNVESAHSDVVNGLHMIFELSKPVCQEGIQQLCEATAYRLIFHDLIHVLCDNIYVGEVATARIDPFLSELDSYLKTISTTVHDRLQSRLITAIMKASFDGFLLILLGGGPCRAFSLRDSQILLEDFKAMKDLYLADGEGLPEELVDKAATQVMNVLPLFYIDTESLIDRYRRMIEESYGPSARTRPPVPPTTRQWNATEPNTVLRVLCHRNDETASKFLKKTYGIPKSV